jgi:D-glycero-D-manno-heptose 1,7-bisphosphate phosphatase
MMPKPRPAVFLDRDGVINRSVVLDGKPYPARSLAEFELFPGTVEACELLQKMGPLIIVTNQPDVGRGTLGRDIVESIHTEMCRVLPISRVEVCYEDGRQTGSQFYKPAPGMLRRAADALNLDLSRSVLIGDRWRDIDCGRAAGCLTIWIDRGYSESLRCAPDHIVSSLPEAAQLLQRLGKIPKKASHEQSL